MSVCLVVFGVECVSFSPALCYVLVVMGSCVGCFILNTVSYNLVVLIPARVQCQMCVFGNGNSCIEFHNFIVCVSNKAFYCSGDILVLFV